ncbi:tyrosine-type recombinase/integrase [Streptomyces sp. NBC_01445]|uniref:tyrosine-type recombinase/integrase n=1 Tax=Streptomyces sp. NBC_01445 TaxID=2903869 RepID=UPI002DDB955A|nr:site-specific integrase [Streptomyces sp. NBC_01445]WSE08936.1 site-specific integrase [Streptomyces sp. NBC_01445]
MATKTLARGMGSFFKECDCKAPTRCLHPYKIRYRDAFGKQREESGYATQDKATARLTEIYQAKKGAAKAGPSDGERIALQTLEDFASNWIRHRARGLTDNSVESYERALTVHIFPRLGSRKIGTFTADTVDDFVADMALDGIGSAAQMTAYKVLRLAINSARLRGALGLDPFMDATPPDYRRKDILIPSLEELNLIRQHAHDEDLRLVVEMMSSCGLRNGEAHATNINGLVADDVYRISNQIHGRQRIPAPLKHRSWGEFRETPLPAKTRAFLLQYAETHAADDHGYLLTNGGRGGAGVGGSPYYCGNAFRSKWRKVLRSAGIKVPYTMYGLRHFFASNCLSMGIPITDVADWMGHKSIEVTYRSYRHLMPSSIGRAARLLNTGI